MQLPCAREGVNVVNVPPHYKCVNVVEMMEFAPGMQPSITLWYTGISQEAHVHRQTCGEIASKCTILGTESLKYTPKTFQKRGKIA